MTQASELQKPSRADVSGVVCRGKITSIHAHASSQGFHQPSLWQCSAGKKGKNPYLLFFLPESLSCASEMLICDTRNEFSLGTIHSWWHLIKDNFWMFFPEPSPIPKSFAAENIVVNNPISCAGYLWSCEVPQWWNVCSRDRMTSAELLLCLSCIFLWHIVCSVG